jgi:hypothetical protein
MRAHDVNDMARKIEMELERIMSNLNNINIELINIISH